MRVNTAGRNSKEARLLTVTLAMGTRNVDLLFSGSIQETFWTEFIEVGEQLRVPRYAF